MVEPATAPQAPISFKVPPHSAEAEQSLLGGLMLDEFAWLKVADKLAPEDFYRPAHRIVFEVMGTLSDSNRPLDLVTLTEALGSRGLLDKVGGQAYLGELAEGTPSAANVGAYAEIVSESATLRRLITAAGNIADAAFKSDGRPSADVLDEAEQLVFEIAEGRLKNDMPVRIDRLASQVSDRLDFLARNGSAITGVASGFDELDHKTAGFQPSDLVIVAARPSMGKTALIVNMAEHAVMNDDDETQHPGAVLIFSMEQPSDQLVMRMLSSLANLDQSRLRTGKLNPEDWERFSSAVAQIKDKKLYIDDTPALTPNDLRTRARRIHRESGGLKMVMVDYLQLMRSSGDHDNRNNEITEISRSLKAMAKELNCPMVVCSQLNRAVENRTDRRPHMADLRESGAIEQDADLILFIYRDEVYNPDSEEKGLAEIIIGKQRNGPTGVVKLVFAPQLTKFDNYVDAEAYGYGADVGAATGYGVPPEPA